MIVFSEVAAATAGLPEGAVSESARLPSGAGRFLHKSFGDCKISDGVLTCPSMASTTPLLHPLVGRSYVQRLPLPNKTHFEPEA